MNEWWTTEGDNMGQVHHSGQQVSEECIVAILAIWAMLQFPEVGWRLWGLRNALPRLVRRLSSWSMETCITIGRGQCSDPRSMSHVTIPTKGVNPTCRMRRVFAFHASKPGFPLLHCLSLQYHEWKCIQFTSKTTAILDRFLLQNGFELSETKLYL